MKNHGLQPSWNHHFQSIIKFHIFYLLIISLCLITVIQFLTFNFEILFCSLLPLCSCLHCCQCDCSKIYLWWCNTSAYWVAPHHVRVKFTRQRNTCLLWLGSGPVVLSLHPILSVPGLSHFFGALTYNTLFQCPHLQYVVWCPHLQYVASGFCSCCPF